MLRNNERSTTMIETALRPPLQLQPSWVWEKLEKRSFCTLATSSTDNSPHVAGVLFVAIGNVLYVNTLRSSRKARNIARNPQAFVCVPVRRLPVGPPSSIQFAATVNILAVDHPDVVRLVHSGALKSITSHGELEMTGSCFLEIRPNSHMHTYGLGMSLRKLIRNPLQASGVAIEGQFASRDGRREHALAIPPTSQMTEGSTAVYRRSRSISLADLRTGLTATDKCV
jgi:Pyridoxamine 5'-phosphate oxidase